MPAPYIVEHDSQWYLLCFPKFLDGDAAEFFYL
jgi:hypothetical protein